MKKIIPFLIILLTLFASCALAQATSPRFGVGKNQDNTGRVLTYAYSNPTYTTPISVAPNAYETFVQPGTLTGSLVVNTTTINAHVGDKINFLFTADTLTAGRVVTFSTNIAYSAATFTIAASKRGSATFIFDGVKWVENSRANQ